MYEAGYQYNTVATARSALASIIHIPGVPSLAEHPLAKRVMKGIFNNRLPRPKYDFVWDTQLVITYMETLPNEVLTFKMLSYKTVLLLTLLSGQRVSTTHKLTLSGLHVSQNCVIFSLSALLKQSKPGRKVLPIIFHRYPHNPVLCPVALLQAYLDARRNLPMDATVDQLIVTHHKRHRAATKDTIARWIREMLCFAGVDINQFQPHSCRAASTSKAGIAGVPISTILKSGQWKSSSVFYKFYKKDIIVTDIESTKQFAESILSTK